MLSRPLILSTTIVLIGLGSRSAFADDVLRSICRVSPSEAQALRQGDPLLRNFYDSMCGFNSVESPPVVTHPAHESRPIRESDVSKGTRVTGDLEIQQVTSQFLSSPVLEVKKTETVRRSQEQILRSTFLDQEIQSDARTKQSKEIKKERSTSKPSPKTEILRSEFLSR